MKMLKTLMMIVLLISRCVSAAEEKDETNKDDFYLLCNVTKATLGVWNAVAGKDEVSEEFDSKMSLLGQKIKELFFGEKGNKSGVGYWNMPDTFTGNDPKRSDVCLSSKSLYDMPSASESMASAILCLCMGLPGDDEDLCGSHIVGGENWPYQNPTKSVTNLFVDVWGNLHSDGVMNKCGNPDGGDDMDQQKKNLYTNVEAMKKKLETKKGILGKNDNKCEGKSSCARVTTAPDWQKKLEEIKEITQALVLLEKREKQLKQNEQKTETVPTRKNEPGTTNNPTNAPAHETSVEPTPIPVNSQVPVEILEQKPQKAPQEKKNSDTKPKKEHEKNFVEIHSNRTGKEEDAFQTAEHNDTSSNFITCPKMFPWLALLL
ncbi:Variant surface glycoprotein [Trypanosoma congolense IL3000]|uniref:Variant surface glycoprotein n=1 Tax=Trypanosoma congolense (strain IL3000) TaxID=1068625 RepID=F9W746_TRYCI|nr:Variant surface glycoprotein [Trypanosoma congolense IL3000]